MKILSPIQPPSELLLDGVINLHYTTRNQYAYQEKPYITTDKQVLLLYADDLISMAESEVEPSEKIVNWKVGMEVKGLQMNTRKTKVMFGCSITDRVEKQDKWPCGVCKKGNGSNSILCTCCQKWVHKRCNGVKGSLCKVSRSFVCKSSTSGRQTLVIGDKNEQLDISKGAD